MIKQINQDRNISALLDINLSLSAGTINVLLGPSGSGKSTLLNIVSTLLIPTAGIVYFDDIEPFILSKSELQEFRSEKINIFHQQLWRNHISGLNLQKSIKFLKNRGKSPNTAEKDVFALLEELNLTKQHYLVPLGRLSGGEQQRIGIILSFLDKKPFILLDEPSSYLDEINKLNVINLIKKEKEKENDSIILITSHDKSFVDLADNIYYLDNGKLTDESFFTKIVNLPKKLFGSPPNEDFRLFIPNIFKNSLEENQIYFIKIINDHPYQLSIEGITEEEFQRRDKMDTVFIKNSSFIIPSKFRILPWKKSQITWKKIEKQIIISLS